MSEISDRRIDRLWDEIARGSISRRDVLRRSLALGLSAPVIAGLLAACGGDDDDDDDATETSGDAATSTPADSGAGGEATPTEAAAAPGANADATKTAEAQAAEPTATEGAEDEPTATEAEEAMVRGGGGKTTLLYWQAPTILNLHLGQGTKDFHAGQVILEPLAYLGPNEEPQLVLAAEWPSIEAETLDPDGLFVIWKLKEGVVWHDGEPFTSADVQLTWQYVTDPDTTATTIATFEPVESVEIIDDLTVQVNFKEPNPAWFDVFVGSNGPIIPAHIMKDYVGEAARDAPFNLAPIGTGPWKLEYLQSG